MKKVKIGEHTTLKLSNERNIKDKLKAFNSLLLFVKSHLSEVDEKAVATSPRSYFETAYYESCNKPKWLTPNECLIASNIDLKEFDKLVSNYLRIPVKFDGINFETKDFNVYATNKKQVETYDKALKVCEAINELIDSGRMVASGLISQGLQGLIIADYSNFPKVKPNPNYIIRIQE
jgi:hypothetical protein